MHITFTDQLIECMWTKFNAVREVFEVSSLAADMDTPMSFSLPELQQSRNDRVSSFYWMNDFPMVLES